MKKDYDNNINYQTFINTRLNAGFDINEIQKIMTGWFGITPKEAASAKNYWYKYGKRTLIKKWRCERD